MGPEGSEVSDGLGASGGLVGSSFFFLSPPRFLPRKESGPPTTMNHSSTTPRETTALRPNSFQRTKNRMRCSSIFVFVFGPFKKKITWDGLELEQDE